MSCLVFILFSFVGLDKIYKLEYILTSDHNSIRLTGTAVDGNCPWSVSYINIFLFDWQSHGCLGNWVF